MTGLWADLTSHSPAGHWHYWTKPRGGGTVPSVTELRSPVRMGAQGRAALCAWRVQVLRQVLADRRQGDRRRADRPRAGTGSRVRVAHRRVRLGRRGAETP